MRDSATAMRGSPTCSRYAAGALSQVPQITRTGGAAPRIASSGISASQTGRSLMEVATARSRRGVGSGTAIPNPSVDARR
ncbi:hypothetical protein ACFXPY_48675 [Streptomyces sp. NPDC059153]|uniref:hypothetical protein n=1 Tax=Streptomyces sp. NPDC059153 TaxID=3346743 RepID=UPI00368F5099